MTSSPSLASAWFLTILSYFIVGFNCKTSFFKPNASDSHIASDLVSVDGFYLTAWEVTLACLLVFSLIGNVAYSLFAYRLKLRSLLSALGRNFKWLVRFGFFSSGIGSAVDITSHHRCFSSHSLTACRFTPLWRFVLI